MTITKELLRQEWEETKIAVGQPGSPCDDPLIRSVIDVVSTSPSLWRYIQSLSAQPIGIFSSGLILGLRLAQRIAAEEKENV